MDKNEQSSRYLVDALGGRGFTFMLPRAQERRIHKHIDRLNASGGFDDDPVTHDNDGIGETIVALLDRGLTESERDAGYSSLLDGRLIDKKPYPLRLRLALAWKELRG